MSSPTFLGASARFGSTFLSWLRMMLVGIWLGLHWVSFSFFDHHIQSSVHCRGHDDFMREWNGMTCFWIWGCMSVYGVSLDPCDQAQVHFFHFCVRFRGPFLVVVSCRSIHSHAHLIPLVCGDSNSPPPSPSGNRQNRSSIKARSDCQG